MKLADIARATRSLDEDAFRRGYPHPALVFAKASHIPEPANEETLKIPDEAPPRRTAPTKKYDPTATMSFAGLGLPESPQKTQSEVTGDSRVWFVVKAQRYATSTVIMVGRAPTNDLRIVEGTISKLHASFTRTKVGWELTDQHSSNGTFVDGKKLPAGGSARLEDGILVAFGPRVQAEFWTPRGLRLLLARIEL